jgi:hypothetical protein
MPPQLARKSADQSGEHGPLARTAEADRPVDAARRPRGAAPAARRPGQTRHGSAAANTGTSELRSGTALEQPCTASSGAIGKRQLTSYASSSGEVHARDVACCQHLRIARQAACQPPVRTALPSAETSHPLNPRGARGALIRSGQNAASPGLLCAHEGSGADQACPGSSGEHDEAPAGVRRHRRMARRCRLQCQCARLVRGARRAGHPLSMPSGRSAAGYRRANMASWA